MNHSQLRQPLLWDILLRWLQEKAAQYKVPLTVSAVAGFLAYTFAFTNKYMSHDEVQSLFTKGAAAESGRWMLNLLDAVFPNLSMPWIYGVITITLVSLTACLMIGIFRIRSHLLQGLLAGCIAVFPSVISVMAYMFTSTVYSLAFLLSVLAVWLLLRGNKWLFLPAVGCMILSLATYQAFIAYAASLLVLFLMQKLLQGDDLPAVIRTGCISLAFLILSLGVYYLSTKIVNWYLGIGLTDYASTKIQFSFSSLPAGILAAYENFFAALFIRRHGLVPTAFSRLLHLGLLACAGVSLLLWCLHRKNRQPGRCALLAVLLLLLPLAINCMYLFTTEDSMHTMVLYSFSSVYVFCVALGDLFEEFGSLSRFASLLRSASAHILPLCMALILIGNIYIANAAYLNMHLRYEIAYGFYSSLIADIKMMPEFTEDTALAVIGYYEEPEFYAENFGALEDIIGVRGFRPSSYSKERFLQYYLDFDIPVVSDEEAARIQQTPEYQQMPRYPYYGSMKLFGNTLVVKLS